MGKITIKLNSGTAEINAIQGTATLEPSIGCFRQDVVGDLLLLVNQSNGQISRATAMFNGIELVAKTGNTIAQVEADWAGKDAEKTAKYLASPEYKQSQIDRQARLKVLQTKSDVLMDELKTLNFKDMGAVLSWVSEMEQCRDHSGVRYNFQTIKDTFEAHGFYKGMNCGTQFDKDDEINFGSWIVGQTLEEIYPPMAGHFYKQWKERFR